MTIRFWGVRGSIPAPSPHTARFGGNTSCVSLDLADDVILVLDAGSGIRALGDALVEQSKHILLLLTHIHWDHIQGFPFFRPIYLPGTKMTVINNHSPEWTAKLLAQMDGTYFPVRFEQLASEIAIVVKRVEDFFEAYGLTASSIETNHIGSCLGYRFERDGKRFVYISDNELAPPGKGVTSFDEFVAFCHGADLLVHDAQYVASDMPHKRGWGHSVVEHVCDLAAAARVKRLALFHHDPARTDDEVAALETAARAYLAERLPDLHCLAAYEGYSLTL